MDRKLWSLAGEGEHIWFLGSLVTIKVPGEAVEGRCTLIEFLAPQGLRRRCIVTRRMRRSC